MLYSGFNNLPRSVFWSADLNGRSDNTDVELKHIASSVFWLRLSFFGSADRLSLLVGQTFFAWKVGIQLIPHRTFAGGNRVKLNARSIRLAGKTTTTLSVANRIDRNMFTELDKWH